MAARMPSCVCVGGMWMSVIAMSGAVSFHLLEQRCRIACLSHDFDATACEQLRERLPNHGRVVGDNHPAGARSPTPGCASSGRSGLSGDDRRPTGGAVDGQPASDRLGSIAQALQTSAVSK